MISRRFLSTLVIVAGLCTLGLEMASLTLLAPYFGISQLVWACAIGLTLLYLTIGYVVGGRVADRRPSMELLCSLLAVAGVFVALIPMLSRPILHWSMVHFSALALAGALLGMLGLFSLPMIVLAMTSPFAVRLAIGKLDDAQVFQLSSMLVAVKTPVGDGVANYEANARRVANPTLRYIMEEALKTRSTEYPFAEWNGSAEVFTDDLAPVEFILHKQLLKKIARGSWFGS